MCVECKYGQRENTRASHLHFMTGTTEGNSRAEARDTSADDDHFERHLVDDTNDDASQNCCLCQTCAAEACACCRGFTCLSKPRTRSVLPAHPMQEDLRWKSFGLPWSPADGCARNRCLHPLIRPIRRPLQCGKITAQCSQHCDCWD